MTSIPPPGYTEQTGGGWSVGGSGEPRSEPPLDPLTRRLRSLTVVLSLLLIAVVVNAWLQAGAQNPLNPIAKAAERTRRMPGAQVALEAIYSSQQGDRTLTAHGAGVYNGRSGRSSMNMELPLPTGSVTMEARGDDKTVYLRSPLLAKQLPPDREWMRIDALVNASSSTGVGNRADPDSQLELLAAVAGHVDKLDAESVRGVPTTRYRATVDFGELANRMAAEGKHEASRRYAAVADQTSGDVPIEVWIDGQGLVRRARMVTQTQAGSVDLRMDLRLEYFHFGLHPKVRLPAAHEVFDATPITRATLGLTDGSYVHLPGAPRGARALAPKMLRSRADSICAGLKRSAKPIVARAAPLVRRLKDIASAEKASLASKAQLISVFRAFARKVTGPLVRRGDRFLRQLGRLRPAEPDRDAYRRFLRLSARQLELLLAEARAFELGALNRAKTFHKREQALQHASAVSGRGLGLGHCGDPSKADERS
jgi:hypothetical protein